MQGLQKAKTELEKLPPDEALAVLDSLEKKRREQYYIKYWQPWEPDQFEGLKKFTDEKKVFVVLGGNRSGKSSMGAAIVAVWLLGKDFFRDEPAWKWVKDLPAPNPPNNVWVVGLDFNTLRDVIWREKFRLGRDHPGFLPSDQALIPKINDGDYQAFFANGSVLTGKSADSGRTKFQGASVDLVWIDEECEAEIFDECYQRTLDCSGRILVTLTPLKDANSGVRTPWVYDLHEAWMSGQTDIGFAHLSTLRNPYIPEIEKERAKRKWEGTPEEGARLYGEFIRRSGLVYPDWNPKKHILPARHLPEDSGFRIVSIDPAATGVTAALWAWADAKGNIFLYREYYERDKTISEHAKSILIRNQGDPINLWIIDPKFGSQRNAETHKTNQRLYIESGIPVRLAEVGEDYGLNISREFIRATVTSESPAVYLVGDLPNFRYEIEHYTWDTYTVGPQKGLSKEKPRKRDDHLMNAFQYLCAMRPKSRHVLPPDPDQRREYSKYNSYT